MICVRRLHLQTGYKRFRVTLPPVTADSRRLSPTIAPLPYTLLYIGEYETDLSDYGGLRKLREPD